MHPRFIYLQELDFSNNQNLSFPGEAKTEEHFHLSKENNSLASASAFALSLHSIGDLMNGVYTSKILSLEQKYLARESATKIFSSVSTISYY